MIEMPDDTTMTASAVSGDFGDAVLIAMKDPGFAGRPLSDLRDILLEPMDRGQLILARGRNAEGIVHPVALVCLAYLSDALNAAMQDYPDTTELTGGDWTSGDHAWFAHVAGPPAFTGPFVRRVALARFPDRPVWFRAIDRRGIIRSERLEALPD
jgi:hemolysin-activating ACP:hemolysin acyltransferase